MTNRTGRFRGRIPLLLLVLIVIPLLVWNARPRSVPGDVSENPLSTENTAFSSIAAGASATGNVQRGRELFMGYAHFQQEGPPCMGCHSVGANGILGGGALGPDLTDVSRRRKDAEILGVLSNPSPVTSPVMQPIYGDDPLTAEEQADLLAFLKDSAGQPLTNKEPLVLGLAALGFLAAAAGIGFVYRGRLRGVRKSLLKKAGAEHR